MKFIIKLEPAYYKFVEANLANPLIFNGWKLLGDGAISMDCKGEGLDEQGWLENFVFPQVDSFRKVLENAPITLAHHEHYGTIITPSGKELKFGR